MSAPAHNLERGPLRGWTLTPGPEAEQERGVRGALLQFLYLLTLPESDERQELALLGHDTGEGLVAWVVADALQRRFVDLRRAAEAKKAPPPGGHPRARLCVDCADAGRETLATEQRVGGYRYEMATVDWLCPPCAKRRDELGWGNDPEPEPEPEPEAFPLERPEALDLVRVMVEQEAQLKPYEPRHNPDSGDPPCELCLRPVVSNKSPLWDGRLVRKVRLRPDTENPEKKPRSSRKAHDDCYQVVKARLAGAS